jgi:hypothetical protein
METYTLTLVDMPGNLYPITVSKNATVKEVIDTAIPLLKEKYGSKFVKIARIFHDGRQLDLSRKLTNYSINPQKRFQILLEDKSAALKYYFQNENSRRQGAIQRAKSNQQKLINNTRSALPNNVLKYEIAPFLQGGKRKTRKSKKSKRQTRRRR